MAEYEGVDALLAALTDEPLPEGARDDAEFMAEHRSAVSDVALLREQLAAIGNTLADRERTESTEGAASTEHAEGAGSAGSAGSAGKPAVVRAPQLRPRSRPRRRPLAVAFGTLAAAAAAALVVGGMGRLISQAGTGGSDSTTSADSGSGKTDSDSGSASLGAPGYVACARLVFEGTVESVEPVPGAEQDRISMTVDRYYKPAKGEDEVTFLMDVAVDPRLRKGDHALIGIPRNEASPDLWAVGEKEIAKERAWITKALPASREITC